MAHHESGGLSSQHDIEIFRAWKKSLPGYTWQRAEVDRHAGLTLIAEHRGTPTTLHFPHALCGYGGEGPRATLTILGEAGFGDAEKLSAAIFIKTAASFTK